MQVVGIPTSGLAQPLHGAANTHEPRNLDVDMPKLELSEDHLTCHAAVPSQRAKPSHDRPVQTSARRQLKKVGGRAILEYRPIGTIEPGIHKLFLLTKILVQVFERHAGPMSDLMQAYPLPGPHIRNSKGRIQDALLRLKRVIHYRHQDAAPSLSPRLMFGIVDDVQRGHDGMNNSEGLSQEERILRVMRTVLVNVIRDTTTKPGLRHPLSERTRDQIRHCLELIAARQAEFAEAAGAPMKERPVFADQPRKSAVVAFHRGKTATTPDNDEFP